MDASLVAQDHMALAATYRFDNFWIDKVAKSAQSCQRIHRRATKGHGRRGRYFDH
jgi:hypothetical protein